MTKEEFELNFNQIHEKLLESMANNPHVNPDKFYTMACFLENISFFSPVIFSLLKKKNN